MTDPIKFTDGAGVEWTLRACSDYKDSRLERDATPDDLLRSGYVLLSDVQTELREALKPLLKAIDEARKP